MISWHEEGASRGACRSSLLLWKLLEHKISNLMVLCTSLIHYESESFYFITLCCFFIGCFQTQKSQIKVYLLRLGYS